MTSGIVIATTNIKTPNSDERVIDSRLQGSWKIAKRVKINFTMTRTGGAAITEVKSEPHNLGFTPAYIAMVDSDIGGSSTLYNVPTYDANTSCKVYVDGQNVYASVVQGLTGTFYYKFKILLLGERIE